MDRSNWYRPKGRIYLYPGGGRPGPGTPFTQGTFWDLEAEQITPTPGMRLDFYADDANERGEADYLLFTGVVDFDANGWYAVIDDGSFLHESEVTDRS